MPAPITSLKTPGVYVYELDSFPPSIAQVATAIPVFIGYTQIASRQGKDVRMQAIRISSLVQYIQYFGEDFPDLTATIVLKNDNSVDSVAISPKYQLFNSIRLFFNHGGTNCYILSVGLYNPGGTVDIKDFIPPAGKSCFDVLQKEDEPTLIVIPDAVLFGIADFNNLMTSSLTLCAAMQDRFTIMDVLNGDQERDFSSTDVITVFRSGVGGSNLNYGAAYYPWLRTSLNYSLTYKNIILQKPKGNPIFLNNIVSNNPFLTQLDAVIHDQKMIIAPYLTPLVTTMVPPVTKADLIGVLNLLKGYINGFTGLAGFTDVPINQPVVQPGKYSTPVGSTTAEIFANYAQKAAAPNFTPLENYMGQLIQINDNYPVGGVLGAVAAGDFAGYNMPPPGLNPGAIYGVPPAGNDLDAVTNVTPFLSGLYSNIINLINSFAGDITNRINGLDLQLASSSSIYANIKTAIKNEGVVVPPAGAMAGVYAAVDGTRGVWKAPANVSLNTVIEPMVDIDDNIQEDLNIDTNAGKSVNAIRTFTGKGVLVWGARTLDGNSNDWRYISVRRFYIMVEESVKKACMQFVFEPNDANTWVKVRAMIENYLTNLWREGALTGSKPEQAFYVKVGLGQTMTSDDILEGRMIVEIGMAPVRPAEFIILRFTQIQQQA